MAAGIEQIVFQDDGRIPNSRLPLVIWRKALPGDPAAMERAFAGNGWTNSWRDGIYPFHHFHSVAHEVLGIAAGQAEVAFGGPSGQTVRVEAGDVVVIPAGVGHCNKGASADFLVVGAYPDGADWDVCRGDPADYARVRQNLARVPLPGTDPLDGAEGRLLSLWR